MAYYVRPDREPGRYIRTNIPDGHYLVHSAKGSEWTKGHKYIDKRWINGAWQYLYPEMLEAAKRAGDAVKDTAKKATDTAKNIGEKVKKTAENTSKAAKDFKNYYKEVDIKSKGAKQTADAQEKRHQEAIKELNQSVLDGGKARNDKREAEKEIKDIHDRWHNGKVVNQQEVQDAHNKKENAEKAEKESHERNQQADKDEQDARDRAGAAKFEYEKAEAEKETAKYKASKALNDLIDGTTGITAQGAQWLKNQYEAGNKFAINTLAAIEEKGMSAVTKGNKFLKNLLKGKSSQAALPTRSSSGRTYSGTGTKARRREAIGGGPVSNNDYTNRPKKRR